MKKIGFFLNNDICKDIDFTNAVTSNPGVGGTEWEFFKVSMLLSRKYDVYFFATTKIIGSYPFHIVYVKNLEDALCEADRLNVEVIVHRIQRDTVNVHKCKRILWLHNDISNNQFNTEASTKQIKAYVFVSKAKFISNLSNKNVRKLGYVCLNCIGNIKYNKKISNTHNICYIGSISPYRETHKLTYIWPKIIKQFPDAKLHIIGELHELTKQLDLEYQKVLMKPIIDNNLENSVIFHGKLSIDDNANLMRQMDIGVGSNCLAETFCLSLTDFERYSIPIVSLNAPVFNEIAPKKCSLKYKYNHDKSYIKQIIKLLNDKNLRKKLGEQGYINCDNFKDERIIKMWDAVFEGDRRYSKFPKFKIILSSFNGLFQKIKSIVKIILKRG